MNKRTTVTHALRGGQLEHVVVVHGVPAQAHTSRAAAMCALMLALALTSGCTFCKTHERTCAIGGGIAITSVGLSMHDGRDHSSGTQPAPKIPTPSVNCTNPESCR